MVENQKMSKSLGNFFTARDILDHLDPVQGGEQLRFFLLRGHYRSEVAFTREHLDEAGATLRGFYTALREVPPEAVAIDWAEPHAARFRTAMDDDFDMPVALAELHELRAEVNRHRSPRMAGLLKALGGTVGFLQQDPEALPQGGRVGGARRQRATRRRGARRRADRGPRRRGISPGPTRSAGNWTRPGSCSRTSPAGSPSGGRNSR